MKNKRKLKQSEVDSIEDCKRRLRVALARGNWKDAAEIHNQLGNIYRLTGRFDDALDEHMKEVNVCKIHNKADKMGLGIAYRNIGEVYIDMKEEDKAIPYIKQYLKLAQDENNCVEEQRALITLARTYICKADKEEIEDDPDARSKQLDLGETYFRMAYKLINDKRVKDQLNNEKELMTMKCNNCQNLGLTLEMKGKLTEAVMWLTKAVEIGKKCSLHEYLHPCYSVLSGIYLKLNNLNEALTAAKEALNAAKAQGSISMEVESIILEAKTLFCMNEVDNGRKILKRLRKRIAGKEACVGYMEDVDTMLVTAIKISRRQDAIFGTDASKYMELMQLHEELGDNYANLANFSEALEHYIKSVQFAEASNVEGKKLSRLYFSIAETYKDKRDYSDALKYYKKEMEMHGGNPVEKFKTQTNITVVMEKLKMSEADLIRAYQTAIDLAKETKSVKREALAYQNLGLYFKLINRADESRNMLEKVEKLKKKHDLSDLEESETDSQDLLDDEEEIDLNNLSSDGETDEEENSEDKKRERGKKKVSQRKNEAGETPLHLAAKRGDIKAVRRLIRQGHEVNIRDTAGWTPLHEASNYGHAEVVAELLKQGARVNDRGGSLCEGITPLHDAAGNGHFKVVDILIEYKANVVAVDDNRNMPMDHLIIWRHTNGQDVETEEYAEYKRVKHLLKKQMAELGKTYSKTDEVNAARKAKIQKSGTEYSLMKSRKGGDDEAIPVKITGDEFDPDDVEEATDMYRSTMKGLMRREDTRRSTRTKKVKERPISPGPRNALIPDALNVHETWLLDDGTIVPGVNDAGPSTRSSGTGNTFKKRKRDPLDDIILRQQSSRRKRNGKRNEVSGMDIPHRSRLDSCNSRRSEESDEGNPSSPMEVEDGNSNDPVMDLMDLEKDPGDDLEPSSSGRSTNSRSEGNDVSPEYPREDDFESLREEFLASNHSNGDEIPTPDLNELEFLPSQLPSTSNFSARGRVFGRMNETQDQQSSSPLLDDSEASIPNVGSDEDSGRNSGRQSQQSLGSGRRSRPIHTISSDDDDEDFRENRNNIPGALKSNNTFSSIASKFSKQPQGGSNSGRLQFVGKSKASTRILTTQTRLPFKRISTGNRSESSPSPEMRRTASTSCLRQLSDKPQNSKSTKPAGEGLRLKVRVLEHTLLVPVSDAQINETVQWLCEQCAIRYMQTQGVKPILTLSTKDGAQLSGSDPISLVLGGNELELVANVTSYDLPPLTQRFQNCCSELKIGVDADVLAAMNMCQSSNILNLADFNLRGPLSKSVFHCLQREHCLRELILSGCSLYDEGMKELCKVLCTLPGLTVLDLSCNGLTSNGFQVFAEAITKDVANPASFTKGPLGLTTLNLSHNPLGNRVAVLLSQFLDTMTNLKTLTIADCSFTGKLFTSERKDLLSSLKKCRVEDLDISYNDWGEIGLEKILKTLNPTRLKSLNCSSPGINGDDGQVFSRVFTDFLTRNEDCCNLKELKLSDCGLTDSGVTKIAQEFRRLVSLESLDLSNNEITVVSVEEVLTQCQINEIPLTILDVGCCPLFWEKPIAPERILLALDRKLQADRKMTYLRLTAEGIPDLEEDETDVEECVSKLESRISRLWEDYAGPLNSSCKKQGNCFIFKYD